SDLTRPKQDPDKTMMKVLLLNNVPAPYFTPLFEQIGKESGWALTVGYVAARNPDIAWDEQRLNSVGFHRTMILNEQHLCLKDFFGTPAAATVGLLRMLARERPDYLISYGYSLL